MSAKRNTGSMVIGRGQWLLALLEAGVFHVKHEVDKMLLLGDLAALLDAAVDEWQEGWYQYARATYINLFYAVVGRIPVNVPGRGLYDVES